MRALLLLTTLLCWCAAGRAAPAGRSIAVDDRPYTADFNQPSAVVTDASGRIYVMDGTHDRVVLLAPDGRVLDRLGGGLRRPLDLSLSEEGLLVADTGNHRLLRYGNDGQPARSYGLPADAKAGPPEPVAVTTLDGMAYWADRKAHRICRTRLDSGETLGCFGQRGEGEGQFQYPFQMAVDRDGYLNVLDIANARIQVFDKTGRHFSQVSRFGLSPGELYRPNGLAMDRETDTLYVADSYFGTISVFRNGAFAGLLERPDGQPVVLDSPTGLSFAAGALYVAETGASRVRRFRVEFRGVAAGSDPGSEKRVEISQKNCVLCHLSWAAEAPVAVRAPDAEGVLPEASFRMCYSCHNGAIMDSRLAIRHGAQHPTVYEPASEKRRHREAGPRKDKLPKLFPTTADKQLRCTTCHTPHTDAKAPDTLYRDHGNAWLRVPNRGGDLCERCHESKGREARGVGAVTATATSLPSSAAANPRRGPGPASGQPRDWTGHGPNHPLGIRFQPPPWRGAPGFPTNTDLHRGLPEELAAGGAALGRERELICQTCHQVHGGDGDGVMTVLERERGELCAACHPRQFSENADDAHDKGVHPVNIGRKAKRPGATPVLWRGKPEIEAVGCETCHHVHAGNPDTPLLPEDVDSTDALCRNCHERQHSSDAKEAHRKGVHPVDIRRKSETPGVEPELWKGKPEITEVRCRVCHWVHQGSPRTALLPEGVRSTDALCKNCHQRQYSESPEEAHRKGVHPVNVQRKDEATGRPLEIWKGKPEIKEVVCSTCHKVHAGTGETALLPEGIRSAEALCQNCHQRQHAKDKDEAISKGVHPVNVKLEEPVEIEGQKIETVGCLSCHAVHKGKPDTAALVATDQDGTLCSHCHAHKRTVVGSDHDLRITAKDKPNAHGDLPSKSGVCGACHTLHRGRGERPFLAGTRVVQPKPPADPAHKPDESPFKRDALCLGCHQTGGIAEKKAIERFSHPRQDLVLRADPKRMPLLGPDEKPADFGAIACVTCHEPHLWDAEHKTPANEKATVLAANRDNVEGSNLNSFLRHKGVAGTFCIDCHGGEGLVKYKYFHDPDRSRNRKLPYLK